MNCKDCKHIEKFAPSNGGIRCRYYCGHKDQRYIYEYHLKRRRKKDPAFICYGGGLYGNIPTIKTSPAWCPLKKKKEV